MDHYNKINNNKTKTKESIQNGKNRFVQPEIWHLKTRIHVKLINHQISSRNAEKDDDDDDKQRKKIVSKQS